MGKKFHYVYQIENKVNGKRYIGLHSTNNLKDSYLGSGKGICKAIKCYGKENFTKTILQFFSSREEASKYESS